MKPFLTVTIGVLASALNVLPAEAQPMDNSEGSTPLLRFPETVTRNGYDPVSQNATGIGSDDVGASQQSSTDDISKQLANPNGVLSTLNLKYTRTNFQGSLPGASDQSSNTLLFQPVLPFPMNSTDNLFIRPAIAYVWDQPVFNTATNSFDTVSGWADVGFDIAYGRTIPLDSGQLIVVGGLQGTIPTYSDVSGEQWRLGPEAAVFYIAEKGYLGAFPQHQWDIDGDYDYSRTVLELQAGLFLKNSWTVYTDSKFAYDWETEDWTLPLNLSVRKVVKFGNTPVKIDVGIDYYLDQNDQFGQDWALNVSFAPVVSNFIYEAFKR